MSRPNKRPRTTVNCRGCGCGHPECESCGPEPEEYPDLGRPQFHQPPPYQRSAQQQSPDRPLLPPANLGPDYPGMLSQLDDRSVRQILTGLAITSPSASDAIASAYFQQEEAKIQEMRAKLAEDFGDGEATEEEDDEDDDESSGDDEGVETAVIDFEGYSKRVWHILYTSTYTHVSSSQQYELSYDAFREIDSCITSIRDQTHELSSFGTKLSALETLRKIAKSVLLATDTLGYEIRKTLQYESSLGDAILDIAESMTPEELSRAGSTTDAQGSLKEKICWVSNEAEGLCLDGLNGFGDVFALLTDNAMDQR